MPGPSFMNLNEVNNVESQLTEIGNQIDTQMSQLNSISTAKAKQSVDDISKSLNDLQTTVNNLSIGKLSTELDGVMKKFDELQLKVSGSFSSQKNDMQLMVDQLSKLGITIQDAYSNLNKLNTVNIGDISSAEKFKTVIADISNAYQEMISHGQFMNIDETTIDSTRRSVMNFINGLTTDISQALDLSKIISSSVNDSQQLEQVFSSILTPLYQAVNSIPQSVVQSFESAKHQLQGMDLFPQLDTNKLTEIINKMQSTLTNIPAAPSTPTSLATYDPRLVEMQDVHRNAVAAQLQNDQLSNIFDRIGMSGRYASGFDSSVNTSARSMQNLESTLNDILERYVSNSFSYLQKDQLKKSGLEYSSIDGLKNNVIEAQSGLNAFTSRKNNLNNSVKGYRDLYEKSLDPTNNISQEQVAAQAKLVQDQAHDAMKSLVDVIHLTSSLADSIKIDPDKFNEMPESAKKAAEFLQDVVKANESAARDIFGLTETFGMQTGEAGEKLVEALKEAKKEMSDMEKTLANMKTDASTLGTKASSMFKDIKDSFQGVGKFVKDIGLGVGIPLSIKDMKSYAGDVTSWYKKFGDMDYESALSQMSGGSSNVNQDILRQERATGIDLYSKTYGRIDYNEYANSLNGLLSGVQGHNGEGGGSQTDMIEMSRQALDMNKLYGVDSQQMIKTFYKELNMSASETNELMLQLAGTAQAANIPVTDYMKTIAQLGESFKNVGIGINEAETGMRNLTLSGMSLNSAQSLVSETGNVASNFSQNIGLAGFYGVASGLTGNPFEAYKMMNDRWDENGYVKEDSFKSILSAIDKNVQMTTSAYGNDPTMQWIGRMNAFKGLGYSQKSSVEMTNAYEKGDYKTLQELFEKNVDETDKEKEVTLKGQSGLEDKLTTSAKYTDELTKAQAMNNTLQMQLATVNKGILDLVGESLQKLIAGLGSAILDLDKTIFGQFNALNSNLNAVGTLIKGLIDHPIVAILAGIAAKLGVKTLGKTLTNPAKVASGINGMKGAAGEMKGAASLKDFKNGTATLDELLSGASEGAGIAAKGAGKIPIVGGVIDGGLQFFESSGEGKTTGYAVGEGIGTGLGSAGGGWGGAAAGAGIGTMIFPGVGTVIGGLIGGIGGAWAGGKAGKTVVDFGMDQFGVQEYENPYGNDNGDNNDSAISPSLSTSDTDNITFKSANDYTSSNTKSSSDFYAYAGVKPSTSQNILKSVNSDYSNNNKAILASPSGINALKDQQKDTSDKIDDMKKTQSNLLEKSNSLSLDSYNLQDNKYKDMIDKASSQFDQITNIARIVDSGFTFLDKAFHSVDDRLANIINKITSSGNGSGSNSGSGSSSSTGGGSISGNFSNGDAILGKVKDMREDSWDSQIAKIAKEQNIDPNLLKAIMINESSGDPNSRSSAGAIGLMQLKPSTAAELGFKGSDLLDPTKNLEAGAKYIKQLMGKYVTPEQIIGGYNAGPNNSGVISGNIMKMPAETQDYIRKVEATLAKLRSGQTDASYGSTPILSDGGSSNSNNNSNDAFGYSSNVALASSPSTSSNSYSGNYFRAPIYVIGSREYSNGAQTYNPSAFAGIDQNKVIYDNTQGMARGILQYYDKNPGMSSYAGHVANADNYQSVYNQTHPSPQFKIEINANNGDDKNYNKMAEQIQTAITGIVQTFMGSTTKVAAVNYNRSNANY